jgi:DNA-binding XRE family transcriptional regulator
MKKEIGKRFKEFRMFLQKSREELVDELRVSKSTINTIEWGQCFPGIPVQNYLNIHYHLNLNWLLTGKGEMILPPGNDSKIAESFKLDDLTGVVDSYEEFFTLMRIPVIEQQIFSKLAELKLIAKDEIKKFKDSNE